jgi:hypothetical protein
VAGTLPAAFDGWSVTDNTVAKVADVGLRRKNGGDLRRACYLVTLRPSAAIGGSIAL